VNRLLAALAALGLVLAATSAKADDFFRGKTIRIIVGGAAGAGYDLNARILARYMPDHIPGKPSIVVQNQMGAGSLIMANSVYNNGSFDGLTIGAGFGGIVTAQLLQPKGVHFDARKLIWLGTTTQDTQIAYVWAATPVKTYQDLLHTETLVGAEGPGASQWDYPMIANAVLGTKFKVISGYGSTQQIHAAMERGELMGNGGTSYSSLATLEPQWLAQRKVNILLVWGERSLPPLAGIPRAIDLAKNDADRQAIGLAIARLVVGKPFFLPPGVPADRVEILRRAFDATMKDPGFLAEEAKTKLDVSPLSGEEVTATINRIYATPPAVIDRVRDILTGKAK
jgi:tripartite-type tricarboxylate transporter receptor subunit TctC